MFKQLSAIVRRPRALLMLGLFLMAAILLQPKVRAEEYLAPEVAFKFSASMVDARTAEVVYDIADGYYMYRDRFHFAAQGATLGTPVIPPGKVKYDENFQKEVETYHHRIAIRIPVEAAGTFQLTSTAQGCADAGLCYPPMDTPATLSPDVTGKSVGPANADAAPSSLSDLEGIAATLKSGKLLAILSLFFLLGLGLSFTPCVLPMLPILSSIIVGEGAQTRRGRSFLLSVMYALGMALVYTILGVSAGLIGEGLSAALQNPWVLSLFALLMVGLSLSMFNVYQLQLPASLQSKLSEASGKQGSGKLAGVFIMGAISALIVGPCVAAPLAGALVYISQTRDVLTGGSALFAMAVGMSVPLLLIGASAGTLLPRAGAWMESVKRLFGVLMLATALWMVSPVIPAWLYIAGWAALGIGYGAYLLWQPQASWVARAFGLVFAALGLLQLVSVATGGRDALTPLSHLGGTPATHTEFIRVKSSAELDAALAKTNGKLAMLDFYADWCVSCKEMEKFTFTDARVKSRMADMVLLQIDVTANNADDKAMLRRFQLFGPPGIIFFDAKGQELAGKRVVGFQNSDKFLQSLDALR